MTSAHAIPTRYAGRRFRSRLEARWAAFFDLVGWRWEYEPFDLSGWIPDFVLIGAATTLVEVKPIAELVDAVAYQACTKTADAVRRSNRRDEILLLGYAWPETSTGDLGLGWLCEWYGGEPLCPNWDVAPFHHADGLGFHHSSGRFESRITGVRRGSGCWGTFAPAPLAEWAEAGNLTQWRAVS
jgi:hypothetical protein